jgi:Lon protease-like protein
VATALDPDPGELYEVGTFATVEWVGRQPCCGQWAARIEGHRRVRAVEYLHTEPFLRARCVLLSEPPEDGFWLRALTAAIADLAERMNRRFPECVHTQRSLARIRQVHLPAEYCGAVGELLLHLPLEEQQRLLETEPLSARLEAVLGHLHAFVGHVAGDALPRQELVH